jgi:hypothetical protein
MKAARFISWVIAVAVSSLLLITAHIAVAEQSAGPWRLTGFTKYRDGLFADTSRLSRPSPETAMIWVRLAPSVRSKYLKMINDYLVSVKKSGRGFKFIEIQCEFNCPANRLRFLKFVYLDKTGKTIHAVDESSPSWFYIPPGNLWGNVEKLACEKP